MTIKCEYCGEEIGLLAVRYTWLDKPNNRAIHDKCLEKYKEKNPDEIKQSHELFQKEKKNMEKCPKCGRHYFSKKQFQMIHNNGQEILVCPVCSKEFKETGEKGNIKPQKRVESNNTQCEYCGKKIESMDLLMVRYTQLDEKNNRLMHEKCYEDYKKENPEKIKQKEAEKQIQKESPEIIQKKNKLRSQKYIGVIFAALGVLFFLSTLLYAFDIPGFIGVSPLIIILFLGIGFWLSYKAEKDLKKLE
jgi:hypothetical protein